MIDTKNITYMTKLTFALLTTEKQCNTNYALSRVYHQSYSIIYLQSNDKETIEYSLTILVDSIKFELRTQTYKNKMKRNFTKGNIMNEKQFHSERSNNGRF